MDVVGCRCRRGHQDIGRIGLVAGGRDGEGVASSRKAADRVRAYGAGGRRRRSALDGDARQRRAGTFAGVDGASDAGRAAVASLLARRRARAAGRERGQDYRRCESQSPTPPCPCARPTTHARWLPARRVGRWYGVRYRWGGVLSGPRRLSPQPLAASCRGPYGCPPGANVAGQGRAVQILFAFPLHWRYHQDVLSARYRGARL